MDLRGTRTSGLALRRASRPLEQHDAAEAIDRASERLQAMLRDPARSSSSSRPSSPYGASGLSEPSVRTARARAARPRPRRREVPPPGASNEVRVSPRPSRKRARSLARTSSTSSSGRLTASTRRPRVPVATPPGPRSRHSLRPPGTPPARHAAPVPGSAADDEHRAGRVLVVPGGARDEPQDLVVAASSVSRCSRPMSATHGVAA